MRCRLYNRPMRLPPDSIVRRICAASRTRPAAQPLMERAGSAAADVARSMLGERDGSVLVLAGPGNNGGDAFVRGAPCCAKPSSTWLSSFAAIRPACPRMRQTRIEHSSTAGGTTVPEFPARWHGSLIVDGLFGIGLARPLSADYAPLVERANASGVPILALDVPSGLDADTGVARGADHPRGRDRHVHRVEARIADGRRARLLRRRVDSFARSRTRSDRAGEGSSARLERASPRTLPAVLMRHARNVHKGTFGTLAIVGGADGMVGAPLLAGRAALHAGAGKVWIGFAASSPPAVDWSQPELMLRAAADRCWRRARVRSSAVRDSGTAARREGARGAGDRRARPARPRRRCAQCDCRGPRARRGRREREALRRSRHRTRPKPRGCSARPPPRSRRTVSPPRWRSPPSCTRMSSSRARAASSPIRMERGTSTPAAMPASRAPAPATCSPDLPGRSSRRASTRRSALRLAVCLHGAAADACVANGHGPLGLTAGELPRAARCALLNEAGSR